ncbi:nuclear transport factor 2 family protein [Ralstonia pseudosolanacearum]|uniref:nuclear transport factor 2 family protein n=1 Tax=Ralstonia pseudosolanacearum TaxID=1310165 RepID=UPI00091426D2|nr:nuclear transport factor 2 family protein [Ralstonia solanacearum]OIT12282.1 hypothetical protein BL243_23375 [Ralstonia solanacearum]
MTTFASCMSAGPELVPLKVEVQLGLEEWLRIVSARDWDSLPKLLAEQISYRSPASMDPYHGKDTMLAIMRAVFSVMQDFQYQQQFRRDKSFVLEFSAQVGNAAVSGVDIINFNDDGKIVDFSVMMRPADMVLVLAGEAVKVMAAGSLSAG